MKPVVVCFAAAQLLCDPARAAVCLGDEVRSAKLALSISEQWPLRPRSDPLHDRLLKPLQRLNRVVAERAHANWLFRIVRNHGAYAYSIGNGRIYLTDGLLDFVANDAELAGVIAHEMGHHLAGHFCRQITAEPKSVPTTPATPTASNLHALGPAVLVLDPRSEMEADAVAADLLQRAGYSVRALVDVTRRLPHGKNTNQEYQDARIAALQALADRDRREPSEHPARPP